jgi:hypothetical protein
MCPEQLAYEDKSHIDVWDYAPWPILDKEWREVEFHLIYQGSLPAAGQGGGKTRAREKHDMRKVFHKQLSSLWKTHPFLIDFLKLDERYQQEAEGTFVTDNEPIPTPVRDFSSRYARCGYRFMPLISEWFAVSCALDILFLRRDGPGSLVKHGGDIDNRLKVLFDALRMPDTCDEVCGDSPSSDEDPFYCLMEDDKLISKVQVETNWLLTPLDKGERLHDVHVIVKVKTIMTGSKKYDSAFL